MERQKIAMYAVVVIDDHRVSRSGVFVPVLESRRWVSPIALPVQICRFFQAMTPTSLTPESFMPYLCVIDEVVDRMISDH